MSMTNDMERKRAAVFARLEASRQSRADAVNYRIETTGGTEKSDVFWSTFNEQVEDLKLQMDCDYSASTQTESKAKVDEWKEKLDTIRRLLADATIFLPTYDAEKAQLEFNALSDNFEQAKSKIVPRKRFTFSRKTKPSAQTVNNTNTSSSHQSSNGRKVESKATSQSSAAQDALAKYTRDATTIENLSGQQIVLRSGRITTEDGNHLADLPADGDLRFVNLTDCTVTLLDVCGAIRIDKLTNCYVYASAVAGSILLHGCQHCQFHFAARQIRLHTSKQCDFYLHVLSRPIIEHCSDVRFGPYMVDFDEQRLLLQRAQLDKETAKGMWSNVDDFGWHKLQQSPNWSIIPDEKREHETKTQHLRIMQTKICETNPNSTSSQDHCAESDDEL